MGIYLLDRVKLSDAIHDPADAAAFAKRQAAIGAYRRPVRILALGSIFGAAAVFAFTTPAQLWLIPAGVVAVLLYAGMPRNWIRLKDLPMAKNALTALAFTLLCWSIVGATSDPTISLMVLGFVFARVAIDAVLCDLDDADSDAAASVPTLPAKIGVPNSKLVIWIAEVTLTLVMLFWLESAMGALWALACLASTTLLLLTSIKRLTDITDARLGIVAVFAWLQAMN